MKLKDRAVGPKMMAQHKFFTPVVESRIPASRSSDATLGLFLAGAVKRPLVLLACAATFFLTVSNLHAASGSTTVGRPVTLAVTAQGTAPFVYQWYKNGALLSGGTTASYTIASATLNDSGTYFATVRNSAGATTSDSATLTVNAVVVPPPPPPPPVVPPPPAPNVVSDSGFESVRVGLNTFFAFQYNPVVANWTYTGSAGITGNNSGFTSGNAASPEGTQVAFVQMRGSATVRTTLTSGRYVVSAMVANRANWGGSQTVLVYIDGIQVGRFSAGSSYTLATTSAFNVDNGAHDILFAGQATNDSTLFLDQVTIVPASAPAGLSVASSGFEAPNVGSNTFNAFRYNPAIVPGTQDWTFQGFSGVTGNNSGFTSQNPNAPEGKQVAFLQMNNSVVSQTIVIPAAGSYQVMFAAAQRANYNLAEQVVQVFVDGTFLGWIRPNGGAFQTFTLPFTATAGSHQLIFKGSLATDATLFLDQVTILQPGS